MDINKIILAINDVVWGWPLIIFIAFVSLATTVMLYGIQFRYFFKSWRLLLSSQDEGAAADADMTPFQSFVNALSTSIGNGSIAGVATAVYAGGPGTAFWIFVFGIFGMALRFAEVFLSSYYITEGGTGTSLGGPMIYLKNVPGNYILPAIYALFCLFLAFSSGNAMQANSIRIGLERILPLSPLVIACILLAFIMYVMLGGAERIVKASDALVPVKVGGFFLSALIILSYHYQSLFPALKTILVGAFTPQALAGGVFGYTVLHAIRFGIVRGVNASEAGLGIAGVLFGGSGSKNAMQNGIFSMVGEFISANLVCFFVALMLVASGVWSNGQTSINLTISAYETVFGYIGGWIVTFLSIAFGIGVLVSYAYVGRACWIYLTKGKFLNIFTLLYCVITFLGALASVEVVWNATDLVNAGLLITNLFGILWLLPMIQKRVHAYLHAA